MDDIVAAKNLIDSIRRDRRVDQHGPPDENAQDLENAVNM
jgi:hypothetical protein